MDDGKALLFIREEIDSIDSELISLLESRLNLSLQIGKLKKKMDKDLLIVTLFWNQNPIPILIFGI